jgi:hypothetical protein
VTDEQFKTWAKSFLERADTYSSWRGAAVEAVQMLEVERVKNAIAIEALGKISALWGDSKGPRQIAIEALAKIKGDG